VKIYVLLIFSLFSLDSLGSLDDIRRRDRNGEVDEIRVL